MESRGNKKRNIGVTENDDGNDNEKRTSGEVVENSIIHTAAITVHKSSGRTMPHQSLSITPYVRRELVYVAMSRIDHSC